MSRVVSQSSSCWINQEAKARPDMAAIRVNRPDLTVPHVCLRVHFIEHGLPIPMGWFEGGH